MLQRRKVGRPKGEPKKRRLVIRCGDETYRAFKKYAIDYINYEEALRALLNKAGVLPESHVF